MNPLTNVKNIQKLSEQELKRNFKTSWHDQYKDSAWIFIGGLPYDLTEGDVICVFSQYGEVVNLNLVRDKSTGKSKGFCFLCYEDQRSTVLAVDNFNSMKVLGRVIRVDHVNDYKPPKESKNIDDVTKMLYETGCAPGSGVLSINSDNNQEECDSKDSIVKNIKKEKKKKAKRDKQKKSAKKKSSKKKKKRKKEESSSESGSSNSSSDEEEEEDGRGKDSNKTKESKETGDHKELKDRKDLEEMIRVKVEEEEEENKMRRREEVTRGPRNYPWGDNERDRTYGDNSTGDVKCDEMHVRRGFEDEHNVSSRRDQFGDGRGQEKGEASTSRRRENWWEYERKRKMGTSSKEEKKGENGVDRRFMRDERSRGEKDHIRRRERESARVDDRVRIEKEVCGRNDGLSKRGEDDCIRGRKESKRNKQDERSQSPHERDYGKSKRSH